MTPSRVVMVMLIGTFAAAALAALVLSRVSPPPPKVLQPTLSEDVRLQITDNLRLVGFRERGGNGVAFVTPNDQEVYPKSGSCGVWVIVSIARRDGWMWGQSQSLFVEKCGTLVDYFVLNVPTGEFQFFKTQTEMQEHLKRACPTCAAASLRPVYEASDEYLMGLNDE